MGLGFKDFFSDTAVGYAIHRPGYPMELVDELLRISPARGFALDCGCGAGQLATRLAERFDAVVATDASAAQIERAQRHERVIYRTALAEDSGLPDRTVDLVTVAQAVHWLDLEKFYAEARRVARPNAAIALIAYGLLQVEEPAVDRVVRRFYAEALAPYWPAERRHVETGYRELSFPFRETRFPPLTMEAS